MIRINLLPLRVSRRQEAVRRELILVGIVAVGLAAFLGVVQTTQNIQVNQIEQANAALARDVGEKKEIVQEVDAAEKLKEELGKKLAVIKQLKANKTGPVHLLDQLSIACPDKLQLQTLDEKRSRLQITGIAVSNEIISEFLSNLEDSRYFDEVYLNAIDQAEQDGVKLKNFSITARLVLPGTKEEAAASEPAEG